jgi:uncharacterized protein YheU (UPF0270 family)
MADFVEVPAARLQPDILQGLLEEYTSRDGTDYGEQESSLASKVSQLRAQLERGDLRIVYDTDSEQWDVLPRDSADDLLLNEAAGQVHEG